MNAASTIGPAPVSLNRIGRTVLLSGLVLSLLIVVFLAWKIPDALPFFPILPLGAVLVWYLFRHPLLNLAVVLASFVLIADFEEGIQPTEVLYGLYYLGFLAHWFITRLFLYGERIFERREDRILMLFLVLMSLSFPITLLYGGTMRMIMGEWLSLSMLAFYWPVREAIERYPRALYTMTGVIFWIGLFVLARNIFNYQDIIAKAAYAWQVTKGRAVTNEGLLMVPAFFALSYFLFAEKKNTLLYSLGVFLAYLGGLILTQSRGYWVAFFVGGLLLFYLVPSRTRVRFVSAAILSSAGILSLAMIFFGDYVMLIVTGLLNRVVSIGSAATRDLSLVNRLLESSAVLSHIATNPILGHGMGVTYRFYDITFEFSHEKSFIHNGYLALWFKFGIWGLGMLLYFFGAVIRRSVRIFRSEMLPREARVAGLAIAGSFIAFSVSANTSNPFYINDTMFIFAVLAGIAGGLNPDTTAD